MDEKQFAEFARILTRAIQAGATIYLCGNGGSAANASHITNDLVKLVFDRTEYPVNAVCLSDNIPLMTALSNDESYANIFSGQLGRRSGSEEDVLLVLTGSGNSLNISEAVHTANILHQMTTLALTGMGGGHIAGRVDEAIVVESDSMQIIEDVHLAIGHMLVLEVIKSLKGEPV